MPLVDVEMGRGTLIAPPGPLGLMIHRPWSQPQNQSEPYCSPAPTGWSQK